MESRKHLLKSKKRGQIKLYNLHINEEWVNATVNSWGFWCTALLQNLNSYIQGVLFLSAASINKSVHSHQGSVRAPEPPTLNSQHSHKPLGTPCAMKAETECTYSIKNTRKGSWIFNGKIINTFLKKNKKNISHMVRKKVKMSSNTLDYMYM